MAWPLQLAMLNFLSPPQCVLCNRGETWLCRKCQLQLGDLPSLVCPGCAAADEKGLTCDLCRQLESPLDQLISVFDYENLIFHKILACFKERGLKEILPYLSRRLVDTIQDCVNHVKEYAVVPVPADSSRLRQRGFNQAQLLGDALVRGFGQNNVKNLLTRKKSSKRQKNLDVLERRRHLKSLYSLNSDMPTKTFPKKILLVDDVSTSLATLETCAAILKKGGAQTVVGVVLAHAEALTKG